MFTLSIPLLNCNTVHLLLTIAFIPPLPHTQARDPIVIYQDSATSSANQPRAKPKPPKKRRVFTRTTGGKNNKTTSSSNVQPRNGRGRTPESSAATGLKDLPWDKLVRKARDLLKLKEQHATTISTLRSDIEALHLAAKEKDGTLSAQTHQHKLQLEEERRGHANRISALSVLHKDELEKTKAELRALAKQNFADKKISNEVSLSIFISF